VKTDHGWVIEFQHSYIKPDERRSRDSFYQKLVWVVDGMRRKRDRAQFIEAWNRGVPIGIANSPVRRAFSDECALLRDWTGSSHRPVFFDFGEREVLWALTKNTDGPSYLIRFSRANFIEMHRRGPTQADGDFGQLVKDLSQLIVDYESHLRAQASKRAPLQGFQRYLARRDRLRRRL
jgi:hypothetical protein